MQSLSPARGVVRFAICTGAFALLHLACAGGPERPPRSGDPTADGGSGGADPIGGQGGQGLGGRTGGGSGGQGGSGGSAGGGAGGGSASKPDAGTDTLPSNPMVPDAGKDAVASAPTFTQVYARIMSQTPEVPASGCWAGPCHAGPGAAKPLAKLDLNTRDKALVGVLKLVVPRNAVGSKLYMELISGKMPEKKPKLPPALLQLVAAWINAGAMND
jgi:hypothetical protein